MKPIINPASEKLIVSLARKLPQSLLLTGEEGIGLCEIAKYMSALNDAKFMTVLPEKDEAIDINRGVIGIDSIRQLIYQTRSKKSDTQIIIIDFAEKMTIQAQNAFLKLLEEPGANTHFILVSHQPSKLLPTIISRTEKLIVKPITAEQSNDLLDNLGIKDMLKKSQLIFIAGGRPAELIRLCNDDLYFEKRSTIIREARELLSGDTYRKLLIAQKYKDDRFLALCLVNDALNILRKSINDNPHANLIQMIDRLIDAYQQIESNGNIRLCLARMVL